MRPWSLIVFALLAPFLFWAAYHYYHDRHRPEPLGHLLLCILLGVAAAWLNRAVYAGLGVLDLRYDAFELAVDNLPGLLAYAVLGIGITEELSKLLLYVAVVIRWREFDEPLDAIVYASFLALGFAFVENLQYLEFVSTAEAFARGFAGPIVHIVFACVWAYPIALARLQQRAVWPVAVQWLLVAAVLHGIYDFVAIAFDGAALVAAAALVVALWCWRLLTIRRLTRPEPRP